MHVLGTRAAAELAVIYRADPVDYPCSSLGCIINVVPIELSLCKGGDGEGRKGSQAFEDEAGVR